LICATVDRTEIRVFNVRKSYRIPWNSVTTIDVVDWWLSPNVIVIGNAAVRISTLQGDRIVGDASTSVEPKALDVLSRFAPSRRIFGY
jgi:hypothetical protein